MRVHMKKSNPFRGFKRSLDDGYATVGDDNLTCDESRGIRGEKDRDAADVARLTEAPQGGSLLALGAALVVFPQGARELGLYQSGGDSVDAHVLRPPLGGQV